VIDASEKPAPPLSLVPRLEAFDPMAEVHGDFVLHCIDQLPNWRRSNNVLEDIFGDFVLGTLWERWAFQHGVDETAEPDFDDVAERVYAYNERHGRTIEDDERSRPLLVYPHDEAPT